MATLSLRSWHQMVLLAGMLLPGIGLIVVFVGAVIGTAMAQSVGFFNLSGDSGFTLEFWGNQLTSPMLARSVLYSLRVAVVSALLSVALAYPIAIWLRRPFPGSAALSAMLKAPMLVPGLVAAFLYINVIAFHGFLNEALVGLGLIAQPLKMQNDPAGIGVIILQVWKNMPFALLLLSGAVQSIHPDLLNAARDLGAGAWDRFRKVTLPLSVKTMQAALVIVFIGAAGDFSFQAVAGPTSSSSLAQYMYTQQREFGRWNDAAVVAVVLMTLSLVGSAVLAALAGWIARGRSAK